MSSIRSHQKPSTDSTSHRHSEVLRTFKSFGGKSPGTASARHESCTTAANKLRQLLEKRQSSMENLQGDHASYHESGSPNTLSMEDLATLLNDSYNLTKHLEQQVRFYQDTVNVLRERSEKIVEENEILYEKLKGNLVTDVIQRERNHSLAEHEVRPSLQDDLGKQGNEKENFHDKYPKLEIKKGVSTMVDDENRMVGYKFHDRQFLFKLEQEMDKIKNLNQQKTHRLESILQSTREELEDYRCQVLKLQSQLRAFETNAGQRHGSACSKCGRKEDIFCGQPTDAYNNTVEKVTRERDELMDRLAKQKSSLAESQQREFEAYIEVKKSVETVEQAQLEKAEAVIKIQQLRSSLEEERKRHENLLASIHEKTKQECAMVKENYEKRIHDLNAKVQEQVNKCDTNENQLDKLSREKVNLMAELEKSKAELTASQVDVAKVTQDAREEAVNATRERVKAQQEIDNLRNLQVRQLREHEQEKASLMTENEELRRRLEEAQNGWVESREECIRTLDKLKKLENDLHLATASKTNVEKARRDNSKFLKQQAEEREKHFQEILEEKEKEHTALRRELEQILEAQMQVSKVVTDESKKLAQKLEQKTQKHSLDKREWREKHAQLAKEIQTLVEQQEAITKKNQHDNKLNRKLSVKVEHLKEENRKALTTIYELLKKQTGLMKERQSLSREVEYLRSQGGMSFDIPSRQVSVHEHASQDHSLSVAEPIKEEENPVDESL